MATSKTEIWNLAMGHLGAVDSIDSDTEKSQAATACRRFYDVSRQHVLRAFPWPFASKTANLVWVADDPTENWSFAYQYPDDCLMLKMLLSGMDRQRTRDNSVKYVVAFYNNSKVIYTDQDENDDGVVPAEYTLDLEDVTLFPPDFVTALSLHLASMIAPSVTAGDPFKLGVRAAQLWNINYTNAGKNSANEENPDVLPDSDMILGRN